MTNKLSNVTMVLYACVLIFLVTINFVDCQSSVNVLEDIKVSVNEVQNLTNYKQLIEINNHYRWKEDVYANVSLNCSKQVGEYLKALRNDRQWAAKSKYYNKFYPNLIQYINILKLITLHNNL